MGQNKRVVATHGIFTRSRVRRTQGVTEVRVEGEQSSWRQGTSCLPSQPTTPDFFVLSVETFVAKHIYSSFR